MLAGKVALVTGAARGIGLCTVKLLLRNGAKVCVSDVSPTSLQQTCDELARQFNKENVLCTSCDVTDSRQLRRTFEETRNKFGSLDIVINNAGIADESQWQKTVDVNLVAMMAGTYLSLEMMSSGGVVVNVSSMGGLGKPMSYAPAYTTSKFGIVAFTRAMKDNGELCDIRVNCICPYFAETDMGLKGLEVMSERDRARILRHGLIKPELVAEGMLQLITDETKSGAVMTVTPGRGISYHTFPDEKPPPSKL